MPASEFRGGATGGNGLPLRRGDGNDVLYGDAGVDDRGDGGADTLYGDDRRATLSTAAPARRPGWRAAATTT